MVFGLFSRARTTTSVVSALAVVAGLGTLAVTPAEADTAPPAGTPATVSADVLPTWQVNGVVWSQDVVGDLVFAGGSFSSARPPGVALGGAGQVAANNFLVYDITTGNRVASMAHSVNGQVLTVNRSPDGSRVYIGGDFTAVDGVARNHIAAFDAATGALVTSFNPSIAGQVSAIAVSGSAVYAGGSFARVNNATRGRLAAFNPATGALLPWAPTADDYKVSAMVVSPDGSKVVVGGSFTTLNRVAASGMGALDAVSGATLPWLANQTIRDGGNASGINSLTTDGTQIYGSGFAFGTGQFEGAFSADPDTGAVIFANDCHGDTYDTFPTGKVVYTVSHAHNCTPIGGFPQTDPWAVNMRHALAFTTYPTGTNTGPDDYGWNYDGVPASSLLQWYPDLKNGSFTGQTQAAWSVSGNSRYVVLGGEFPRVNGTAQQGLVRFALRDLAPNKRAPVKAPAAPPPSATSLAGGTARVAWQSAYDMDNASLTYQVYRSGTAAPVYTRTQDSDYWTYPMMGFVDTGLTPGATYTYTVRVTDPTGNVLTLPRTTAVTVSAAARSRYSQDVIDDGASDFWRLGEASGSTVYDHAGFNDATAGAGVTRGTAGAVGSDADGASSFTGAADGFVATSSAQPATSSFSIEAWVRTTSTSGGKVVGYGNSRTGDSSGYDRHVYLDNAGHVIFGVYPGGVRSVQSAGTYNDGSYHHIVGSLSATTGMALYVDGRKVAADAGATSAQDYEGFWRIGGDNLGGWPNQPASSYLAGAIDDVAIYPSALTLPQVQRHYTDSGRSLGIAPRPTDGYGKAVYASNPDLYWRLGDSGTTARDTSPNGADGVYFGGTTPGQPGGVAGTSDTSVRFDGLSGGVASASQVSNPTVYSEELWFKTTTTNGGKLIGFGNRASGTSDSYDRHVYMETGGQLTFGVYTGQLTTVTSPKTYNDGAWHHLVASQGPGGMALSVDGAQVGSRPETSAQGYDGYWRVGGDSSWGGQPWFDGTIDEVAVYSSVLSAADVAAHYTAGSGTPVPNARPTAAFSSTTSGLTAALDASASADGDGSVASYAWGFGDGTTGTGVSPSHAYAAGGTYPVTLTVTDDRGATGTVTHDVTVAAPPPAGPVPVASDDFERTLTGGWGSADSGGAWTVTGSRANFTVGGGAGSMTMPAAGSGPTAALAGVSTTGSDVQVTVSPAAMATGGGTYTTVYGRVVGTSSYRATLVFRSNGTVTLGVAKVTGGTTTTLVASRVVTGLTYAAGDRLVLRFQATGTSPTTLRAKVWKAGQPEPATWQEAGTDSTPALQAAGSVTLMSYLSGTSTNAPAVLAYDALRVQDTGGR